MNNKIIALLMILFLTTVAIARISSGGGGGLGNVVEDTTPQLGGALDAQSNNITDVGNLELGTTGVRMSSDNDGAITFLGQSAGADEDLTINLDDTANEITVTSSTGANVWNMAAISLQSQVAMQAAMRGYIQGAVFQYTSSNSVTPTVGEVECNGSRYTIAASEHTITNFANDAITYVMIDDSASTAGSDATLVNDDSVAITPAYNTTLKGWYSNVETADRVIAAFRCASASTIEYFDTNQVGDHYVYNVWANRKQIASSMNPDFTWQTPDDSESSAILPVMATEICGWVTGQDADNVAQTYIASKEVADVQSTPSTSAQMRNQTDTNAYTFGWVKLGSSRNVRIAGADDDDNSMNYFVLGYAYER